MSMNKIFFYAVGLMMVISLSAGQALAAGGAEQKAGAAVGTQTTDTMGSHRGSELMNKSVLNDQGENLGNVHDFVFSSQGDLSYLVISSAEDKLIPIPSEMVKFKADQVVVSDVDKNKLQDAPTISAAEWDKLDDPTFGSKVHGYYREGAADTQPGAAGATGGQKRY